MYCLNFFRVIEHSKISKIFTVSDLLYFPFFKKVSTIFDIWFVNYRFLIGTVLLYGVKMQIVFELPGTIGLEKTWENLL